MKVVLELGDWVLAEDDEGQVRLWSNGITGETRKYEDVPKEVEALLASDDGPPPSQPAAGPPAQEPAVKAPETQPFKRACGSESAVGSTAPAGAAEAKPFTRQRGLAAAPAAAAPMQLGSATSLPLEGTMKPPPLPSQGYSGGGAPAASLWPDSGTLAAGGPPQDAPNEWCEPGWNTSIPLHPSAYASSPTPEPPAAPEPEPEIERPSNLPSRPVKEPTAAILAKATTQRPSQGQTTNQFLEKLTHLHLAEKGFTSLGNAFNLCQKLRVLNLERNHLQDLSGIRSGAEVLHLQGNDVWNLSSWTQNLPKLTTLELAENRLSVLSGLRSSTKLEELNLRGQRSDTPLKLHIPTLRIFSRSLRSLDISRNRMSDADIAPVASLILLDKLDVANNMLAEMASIGNVLQPLARLTRLSMVENPVCWMRKYRDLVIVAAGQHLVHLDGKDVQPNEYPFLVELHNRRRRRNASEPPRQSARSGGSTPGAAAPPRSTSLGEAPPPPKDKPAGPPCFGGRHRSRSSSVDPAARHYRRRTATTTTKLPPLPPRV